MSNFIEPIVLNTDNATPPTEGNNLLLSRKNVYTGTIDANTPTASIFILGYNRLQKTKHCVEAVLKYTKDVDYELILIDNGSTDGTYDYFQEIEYSKKKVVHITKNIGGVYGMQQCFKLFNGNYFIMISNDTYVTKNWLSNLIKCYESDPKIGFVTPMSSNISNNQQVDLQFSNLDEMQSRAAIYNVSDPKKWEERMRMINIIAMFKREVIDTVGIFDVGFFHDFTEDDYCARIRRAGYKIVLCGDTFVHHDHNYRIGEDKDYKKFNDSIERGKKNFQEKYYNIDAWDDINNLERNLISFIDNPTVTNPTILGIDVRCGSPILEIRNKLRKYDIYNSSSYAFTTNAKYYADLLFATNGNVYCDRIEYLNDYFTMESFDYIILGEPINLYSQPIKLIQRLLEFCKKGSNIMFKLRNTLDARALLSSLLNNSIPADNSMPIVLSVNNVNACLELMNVANVKIGVESHNFDDEFICDLQDIVENIDICNNVNAVTNALMAEHYLFYVTK